MSIKGQVLPYKGIMPTIAEDVYIAPGAMVIGDVHIGSQSSVWPGCVIRGDVEKIRIGKGTNIQDGTVIHVSRFDGPTIIGNGVTIGHMALLHACILEDYSFIGMQATVMDHATVETGGIVAAGAIVTPRKTVPKDEIWAGNPAKFLRKLSDKEAAFIKTSEDNYIRLAKEYMEG